MARELDRLATPFTSPRGHWHVTCRDLTTNELQACRRAMETVTSNNPYLLRGFYEYYSAHELVVGSGLSGGRVMETSNGSDTVIDRTFNLLTAGPAYLGGLLVHELVHTRHTGAGPQGLSDYLEGDAYGVEWAIVHRFGDSGRAARIADMYNAGGIFGAYPSEIQTGRTRFDKAQIFITAMMDICDNGRIANAAVQAQMAGTNNHPLAGISRVQAQRLVTEFVKVGDSASPQLADLIAWITPTTATSLKRAYGI